MDKVRISNHKEYELYVRKNLKKEGFKGAVLEALVKHFLLAFEDGIKFDRGQLVVDV